MTPKEKAKELIDKFDVKYQYELITGSFPVSMHDAVIKQCALICVDEIINCDSFFETLEQGKKFNQYWHEVQDEIEKL